MPPTARSARGRSSPPPSPGAPPPARLAAPGERLTLEAALAGYLAPPEDPGGLPARICPGAPASLVVLRTPLAGLLTTPAPVRAVLTQPLEG